MIAHDKRSRLVLIHIDDFSARLDGLEAYPGPIAGSLQFEDVTELKLSFLPDPVAISAISVKEVEDFLFVSLDLWSSGSIVIKASGATVPEKVRHSIRRV